MRITTKGQVTIPQHIREKLGMAPATEIEFVEEKRRVYIIKKTMPNMIYAEISIGFERIEECESALTSAGLILLDIPKEDLFLAGKVFLSYKKRHGKRRCVNGLCGRA